MADLKAGLVAVDGQVFSRDNAKVSAFDRGFLLGDAVFETMAAAAGRILDLDRHLARLRRSAEAVAIDLPATWTDAVLGFELAGLVEQVAAPRQVVRLTVTRGAGFGLLPAPGLVPSRVVHCHPTPEEPPATYRDGLALKRVVRPGTARCELPKTPGSYLPAIVAMRQAAREGYSDLLWTSESGEVSEASAANIFLIARDGDLVEIVTPPVTAGIVAGVKRARMIELLNNARIPVREQQVYADELPRFDEAFLTSSVRGLVPVSRIDRHKLHSARDGAIFRQIERLHQSWSASETASPPTGSRVRAD